MHQIRMGCLTFIIALAVSSCIKTFEPVIKGKDAEKYVVTGEVILGDVVQNINISKTSSIREPAYIPVKGCIVTVIDGNNNKYPVNDLLNGNYTFILPENVLKVGSAFKVDILTPEGENIVSDFDQIQECPDVDSAYYLVKPLATNDPEKFIQGIQFYINLNATNTNSHYFRWEAIETWEHHSTWPIEWYYDGTVHHVFPPDYSRFVCWKTQQVENIFDLTTENLAQNKYSSLPLHYVDNYSSPRLMYGYSLLIRQYALSKAYYSYWEKLRINITGQGGLYEKQPIAITGNMLDITHPDQEVLGFFGASAVKLKRIFVSNIPDLPIDFNPNCVPGEPMRGGFAEITDSEYPAYLFGNHEHYFMRLLSTECVDCLNFGGTNVKPSFWPN